MNVYVGNLPRDISEQELEQVFSACGTVNRVKIIKDPETGLPKGFAFISFGEPGQAMAAMRDLNGTEVKGRKIVVNEAKTKAPEDPLKPVFSGRGGNPNRKIRNKNNGNF